MPRGSPTRFPNGAGSPAPAASKVAASVEDLPVHTFPTDDGDIAMKCPTEIAITDRREFELSNLGFLPMIHAKGTDFAVFMGAQSCQKPKTYFDPDANANAELVGQVQLDPCARRDLPTI